MPTIPLREAAMAAIAARLVAQMPDVVVERARRSAVVIDEETLPRLILRAEDMAADDTEEPARTHYTLTFSVACVAAAATDLAIEQALSLLHARVVDALAAWTPADPGLGDIQERGAEFRLYEAEESAQPAGEFIAGFAMLAVGPAGGAWSS